MLKTKCVNAHDCCNEMNKECPLCEPVKPLRDAETGRFVSYKMVLNTFAR